MGVEGGMEGAGLYLGQVAFRAGVWGPWVEAGEVNIASKTRRKIDEMGWIV